MISGLKYLSRTTAIVERPPIVRSIYANDDIFRLSFPYQIYIIRYYYFDTHQFPCFRGLFFALTKKPLKNIEDNIYDANLPNTGSDGSVCFGGIPISEHCCGDIISRAISLFWQTKFEEDCEMRYLAKWEKKTKKNKDYWKEKKFKKIAGSIGNFIDDLEKDTIYNSLEGLCSVNNLEKIGEK